MGILYAILFTGAIRMFKVNPRKTAKSFKKGVKFWIKVTTELIELISIIFNFMLTGVKAIVKKNKVEVKKVKNDKVIDLADYKLKKAK